MSDFWADLGDLLVFRPGRIRQRRNPVNTTTERPARGDRRRWVPASRRDPHTILRIDTLNDMVLMKYSDRTTAWDEGEYYMAHTEPADG